MSGLNSTRQTDCRLSSPERSNMVIAIYLGLIVVTMGYAVYVG